MAASIQALAQTYENKEDAPDLGLAEWAVGEIAGEINRHLTENPSSLVGKTFALGRQLLAQSPRTHKEALASAANLNNYLDQKLGEKSVLRFSAGENETDTELRFTTDLPKS